MNLSYAALGLIALLGAISPGPDFVLVSRYSLLTSRKAGMFAAFGVAAGLSVHISYAAFGLRVLTSEMPKFYFVLKVIGAAYLTYLGVQLLWQAIRKKRDSSHGSPEEAQTAFRRGFFCNLLNPKASLFILTLYTQFLDPSASMLSLLGMGMEIAMITLAWFLFLSLTLSFEAFRLPFLRIQKYAVAVMGIALLGFAFRLFAGEPWHM